MKKTLSLIAATLCLPLVHGEFVYVDANLGNTTRDSGPESFPDGVALEDGVNLINDGPGGGPTVAITPNTVSATTTVTAMASESLAELFLRVDVTQN